MHRRPLRTRSKPAGGVDGCHTGPLTRRSIWDEASMTAILLYAIGLVTAAITVVVAALGAPDMVNALSAAYQSGLGNVLPALARIAGGLSWALAPFLGGLLLMGFARIIILLGSINRALRGPR